MTRDKIPKFGDIKRGGESKRISLQAVDLIRRRRFYLGIGLILLSALVLVVLRLISGLGQETPGDWYGTDLMIDYNAEDEIEYELFNTDYGTANLAYLLLKIKDVQAVSGNQGWLYEAELLERLDLDVEDRGRAQRYELVEPGASEGPIFLYELRPSIRMHGKAHDYIVLESPHCILLKDNNYLVEASACESVPNYSGMNSHNTFKLGFDKQEIESFLGQKPGLYEELNSTLREFFDSPMFRINFQVIPVANDITSISEIVTQEDSIQDWINAYTLTESERLPSAEWQRYNFYGTGKYRDHYENYIEKTLDKIHSLMN